MKQTLTLQLTLTLIAPTTNLMAEETLPDSLTAAILLKLAEYNKTLQAQESLRLLILNKSAVSTILTSKLEQSIGASRLASIDTQLNEQTQYHIIYTDE